MDFKEISKLQWIKIGIIALFLLLFIFRERIFETKIAKAKMKIFETLISDDPEEAKENIKNIVDTLINH